MWKLPKQRELGIYFSKKEDNFTNRPNNNSIPRKKLKVNGDISKMTEICILQKEELWNLYNIPDCNFQKLCYYIDTKR